MKLKKTLIIIIQIVIILILSFVLFKINKENDLRKHYLEYNGKNFDELTIEQYEKINDYLVFKAKEDNEEPDTISYLKAKQNDDYIRALLEEKERESTLKQINCDEILITNAFHEMMTFNYPYEKYNKNSINVSTIDNCTIRINVTTTEPKYGWKTFWIFEVYFDVTEENYKMKTIKRDFLG